MTVFWFAVAGLVIVALAFLLPPLLGKYRNISGEHAAMNVALYREQFAELERDLNNGSLNAEQYEESRRELDRRLLADAQAGDIATTPGRNMPLAAGLLVVIPLVSVLLYHKLGSPQAVAPQQTVAAPGMGAGHATGGDLNPLVEKLAARLRDKTPEDGEGWALLAHSYIEVGRFPDAVRAFEKAVKLLPPDAQLLADYADAQAMVNNRSFDGKPAELIKQALAADPNNLKVLMLAGSEAFARKDYAHAVDYWEKLLKLLPPDSDEAREFTMGVKEAKNLLSPGARAEEKLDNLADFAAKENVAASTGGSVSGVVSLSPALAAKVSPTDKLFIFARALSGPKMPLAIVEAQVKDLPFKFTLTDAMAMMPQLKLSGFSEIVVVARVSKSGNASPQSGDLQGGSSKVKAGEKNVRVTIDAVVP